MNIFAKVDASGVKSCGILTQDPFSRVLSLFSFNEQISDNEYSACNQDITDNIANINIENLNP